MGSIDADRLLAEATELDTLTRTLAAPITDFLERCGSVHPPEVLHSIVRLELLTAVEDMAMLALDGAVAS